MVELDNRCALGLDLFNPRCFVLLRVCVGVCLYVLAHVLLCAFAWLYCMHCVHIAVVSSEALNFSSLSQCCCWLEGKRETQ